ncbi:hypothetical protein BGX29_003324, partial [Mortierella sp. GBA35]
MVTLEVLVLRIDNQQEPVDVTPISLSQSTIPGGCVESIALLPSAESVFSKLSHLDFTLEMTDKSL